MRVQSTTVANGKVERSQRTDIEEFYSTVDLAAPDLEARLQDWQDHYNQFRVHGSLNGLTPWEKWYELAHLAPYWDEVEANYDETKERIQHPNYQWDRKLRALSEQGRKTR